MFPSNANGRPILPPLARRTSLHKQQQYLRSEDIALPVLPDLFNSRPRRRPMSKYQSPARNVLEPIHTQKRVVSSSSASSSSTQSDSEDDAASTSTLLTTPSSRSPSPAFSWSDSATPRPHPNTSLRLIPRAPFPSNVSLAEIMPEDALVFFPDGETGRTTSSRAVLLMGPAIARHIHGGTSTKVHGSARGHPYRIAYEPAREARRPSLVAAMRKQVETAKMNPDKWSDWAKGAEAVKV